MHPHADQLFDVGIVLGLGQQVHREQLAGDARQQLRLHSGHAAKIVDLALEQGRQPEVLFEVLDIVGKLAGQQGRHPRRCVGRVPPPSNRYTV